ncbi:hypothetical protein NDU88_002019 [Pleurodeles waltl]|uniref:Uncharacterized protein n=1 Tax=Pleurodeles waltl TaxID=8319 RepID=A0AAV7TJG2_PLEWA|nr:hypothetical protein NDU88_002019 [Pleurodeles waltl]
MRLCTPAHRLQANVPGTTPTAHGSAGASVKHALVNGRVRSWPLPSATSSRHRGTNTPSGVRTDGRHRKRSRSRRSVWERLSVRAPLPAGGHQHCPEKTALEVSEQVSAGKRESDQPDHPARRQFVVFYTKATGDQWPH